MEFKRWGLFRRQGNSGLWGVVRVRKAGMSVMIQAASTFLTFGPRGYKRVRKQSLPLRSSYLVGEPRGVAKRHTTCMEPRGEALPSGAKSKGGGACEEEG